MEEFYVKDEGLVNYEQAKEHLKKIGYRLPNKKELMLAMEEMQRQAIDLKVSIVDKGKDYKNVNCLYTVKGNIFEGSGVLGYYIYPIKNKDPDYYRRTYFRSKIQDLNKLREEENFTLVGIKK